MDHESASTPNSVSGEGTHKWSCTVCATRKVRCDRKDPCTNCVQRREECIFKAPAPPKRRKRKASDADTVEKGERHERILKKGNESGGTSMKYAGSIISHGDRSSRGSVARASDATDIQTPNPMREHSPKNRVGIIVSRGGDSRYLENNLWLALGDEINNDDEVANPRNIDSALDAQITSGVGTMVLGRPSKISRFFTETGWSRTAEVESLFQAFMANVEPLTKVVHIPTLEKIHRKQLSSSQEEYVDQDHEVLLISTYLCGAMSLHCLDKDLKVGGIPITELMEDLFELCKQALIQAEFLRSSSIGVLQGYVLYLVALWATQRLDEHSFYSLSGIAVRTGQRMGLHRDGAILDLNPFETEIRRRLWWAIVFVDVRAAELAGAGTASVAGQLWDTKPPLNINDTDIDPSMTEEPVAREGATEMMFSLARCSFAEFLKQLGQISSFGGSWHQLASKTSSESEKRVAIEALQKQLEERFLRYCDPLNPLHLLTSLLVRSVMTKISLISASPRQYIERGEPVPEAQRNLLFTNSLKIIEYDNMYRTIPTLRSFTWHVQSHLQWHAIIFLVGELRYRTEGNEVQTAWRELDLVFDNHPEILEKRNDALPRAVITLCKKAWRALEDNCRKQRQPRSFSEPRFVRKIFATASKGTTGAATSSDLGMSSSSAAYLSPDSTSPNATDSIGDFASLSTVSTPFDHLTIDWNDWEAILREFPA